MIKQKRLLSSYRYGTVLHMETTGTETETPFADQLIALAESDKRRAEAEQAETIALECDCVVDMVMSKWRLDSGTTLIVLGAPVREHSGWWVTYQSDDPVSSTLTEHRKWIPERRVDSIEPIELRDGIGPI